MTRLILTVFALLILNSQNYQFKQLGIEDGLSQSNVYSILQDAQKYLWFATEDGLNSYDGYNRLLNEEMKTFARYTIENSDISNNRIWSIESNKSGEIWLATENGLNHFNTKTGKNDYLL